MSKLDYEENSHNLNIEDIFNRKIEIGAVIQFSLLQNIIEEFIRRQKTMTDKINILETKFESINNNQGITNYIINKDNNNNNINEELNKLLINDSNNEISNENNENIKEENVEDKKKEKEKEKDKKKEKEKEIINTIEKKEIVDYKKIDNIKLNSENANRDGKIRDLSYRIDKLESINNQVIKTIMSFSNENKNNMQKFSDNFEDKIKLQNNNINKISNDIKSLESKIGENSLLSSILKINENSNNDQFSILIHSLDEKISKKIFLLEEHNKDNEQQIIKLKKDIVDLKNINQASIQSSNNMKDNYQSLLNEFNKLKTKIEKDVNELNGVIDDKVSEVKSDVLKRSNEQNQKISDLIIEYNALNQKNQNKGIDTKLLTSLNNEKIENMSIELKHYFNKSISDNENYLKSIINNLGIEKIKADLIKIHQELQNKLIQKDLSLINYKLDEIDTKIYEFKNNHEDFKNKIEELNNENLKHKKMVDYLAGQIIKSYQPGLEIKENNYSEDLKLYVKKDIFEEEITKILKKIEKMYEFGNENNKYIQIIEEKMENFVTDKDLKNMQHYIMNIIEEFKILVNKKYLEKKDAQKSFKFLQLQIKSINENINITPSFSSGDN